MTDWALAGRLKSGETVYVNEAGTLAVEKDCRHLVDPTRAEADEIHARYPHLMPRKEE